MNIAHKVTAGALLISLASVLCSPARADEDGYAMAMQSPHTGIMYMYVSKDGIGMLFPKTQARIASHSPSWKIVMYNEASQRYYMESMEAVSAQRNPTRSAASTANSIRVGATGTIAGKQATQYLIRTMSDSGPKLAEAWITSEIVPPAQLIELFGKLFRIETTNFPKGMPLRIKLSDDTGKRDLLFDVLKIEKQKLKTSRFESPKGYQRADNEILVLVDKDTAQRMEKDALENTEFDSILPAATAVKETGEGDHSEKVSLDGSEAQWSQLQTKGQEALAKEDLASARESFKQAAKLALDNFGLKDERYKTSIVKLATAENLAGNYANGRKLLASINGWTPQELFKIKLVESALLMLPTATGDGGRSPVMNQANQGTRSMLVRTISSLEKFFGTSDAVLISPLQALVRIESRLGMKAEADQHYERLLSVMKNAEGDPSAGLTRIQSEHNSAGTTGDTITTASPTIPDHIPDF